MDPATLPYRPCVGIMVLNARGDVWVGRRSDRPGKEVAGGWWQMPQGGIDHDEEPRVLQVVEIQPKPGRFFDYDWTLPLKRRFAQPKSAVVVINWAQRGRRSGCEMAKDFWPCFDERPEAHDLLLVAEGAEPTALA